MKPGKCGLCAVFICCILVAASCSSLPKGEVANESMSARGKALVAAGEDYLSQGNLTGAESAFIAALDLYSSVDDTENVSMVQFSLGRVYLDAAKMKEAKDCFDKAQRFALWSGSLDAVLRADVGMGEYEYRNGNIDAAATLFASVLGRGKNPSAKVVAIAWHDQALVQKSRGDFVAAVASLNNAIAINTRLVRYSELGSNYFMLASVNMVMSHYDAALVAATKALEADKKLENKAAIAQDLSACASIYDRQGNSAKAYEFWQRTLNTAIAANSAELVKKALPRVVALANTLGTPDEARQYTAMSAALGK